MFKRIVIALQKESDARDLALVARTLAAGLDSAALVLHVRKVSADGTEDEPYDTGEGIAAAGQAEARKVGLHADTDVLTADQDRGLGQAIADVAHGWQADAIVMGSRRLSDVAAALHGSVSHDVIRLAGCPVVVAGESDGKFDSILLAVDGTPAALASERLVESIARETGAAVAVVHVPRPQVLNGFAAAGWYAPPPEEDDVSVDVAQRLRKAGVHARPLERPLFPPIADAIAQAADLVEADLIVVGSRGLTDMAALLRGSVSHEVLHATSRPVLITRADDK